MSSVFDISKLRHSAAHLLGHAVSELYPDTLLTIGPATKEGFFYDFLPQRHFKEEDLIKIDMRMRDIVARDLPLLHKEISKEEARMRFQHNRFKMELIDQIPGETVGLASQGDFHDLCRGGHVASTGMLAHFKLCSISGSYWRADQKNAALQRIAGIVFFTADDLAAYEKRQQELLMYDHRLIGKQLDLFSFHDEGVGFPFFHPRGMAVINVMTRYMRQLQQEYEYQEIKTPTMLSDQLWQRSGHYAHYHDKMYFSSIDEMQYAIKPMNCPGAILTYATRPRSYRELPLKLAEFGHVHRHELSGVLHGLMRVRAFTQDDAHIFCTPEQIAQQIVTILTILQRMLRRFGFEKSFFAVATRPPSSMGSDVLWKTAVHALKDALQALAIPFAVKEGEGAFYGPKIDVDIEDSLGRRWQCGTVQVDFFQPENFDLHYMAPTGERMRPVIIHQAIYGSLERFFAIMLEHHRGHIPLWLAPVQVRVMGITDAQQDTVVSWVRWLKEHQIRAEIDETNDPLKGKIQAAAREKIPLLLIIGAKEMAQGTGTVRLHNGADRGAMTKEEFLAFFQQATREEV